tara:strand:+ start:584 stop:1471 length:888 start_codon:yes stop_codon:yes gene_type:complete
MAHYIFYIFLTLFYSCSSENEQDIDNINFGSIDSLDIITWNIENFPKSDSTIDYVSGLIQAFNDIDIIALQEISDQSAFNSLINALGSDLWFGYRGSDNNYQSLAYLINTRNVEIIDTPYSILEEYEYYFAYRPPYVTKILFNNQEYILIDVHLKCCGDGQLDENDTSDEETRRLWSNYYLKQYIDTVFSDELVIVLGDFNDELIDSDSQNVFQNFIDDSDYYFADFDIANGDSNNWSFPGWPSHLDHILMVNQPSVYIANTLRLEDYIIGGWGRYDNDISDHRPVGVSISVDNY